MNADPMISEPDEPYPPRYWWLKRITAGVCVAFAFMLLIYLVARWNSYRRLAAEIEQIRARNEPILPTEFSSPRVPDASNYATFYRQAIGALHKTIVSPSYGDKEYPEYLPMPAEWYTEATNAIAANGETLRQIRIARQHSSVDWQPDLSTPVFHNLAPMMLGHRQLCLLLRDVAIWEHLRGNDVAAFELIEDLLTANEHLRDYPGTVPFLIAQSCDIEAMNVLMLIAPGLRISDEAPQPQAADRLIYRDRVRSMLARMSALDRSTGIERGLLAERMESLDLANWFTQSTSLLTPVYQRETADALRAYRQALAASREASFPRAMDLIQQDQQPERDDPFPFGLIRDQGNPARFEHYLIASRYRQAEIRMASISLATRLYQLDHGGAWPDALGLLVPRYLATVPEDPFAGNGRALGYMLARGGARPVVYTIGEDLKDDTVDESLLRAQPTYSFVFKGADQWRDLSRFEIPATAPAIGPGQ